MVLESFAANCIGWLPPAFVSLMIDSASEVQGERRAELARCISNASAKVLHFSPRSKFQSSNWGDFQHQFTPFLTSRNFRGINPQYTPIVFYSSSMAGKVHRFLTPYNLTIINFRVLIVIVVYILYIIYYIIYILLSLFHSHFHQL